MSQAKVEQDPLQTPEKIDHYITQEGTEVTHRGNELFIKPSPDSDPRIAGILFSRQADGTYAEIPPEGSEFRKVIRDGEITVEFIEKSE